MKRTERDIYDFVKKNLEEAKDRLSYLTSINPHFDEKEQSECLAKIEAYEEVLNFIGTIRTKGE